MALRNIVLSGFGLAALGSSAALASGGGCATCYRHVVHPPVYGAVSEQVMVRPEQTIAHTIPAQYGTVAETVLVAPARKVWQVTRGPYGEAVGCWVVVPAQYGVQHRHVMVRPAQIVPETIPAVYATRTRSVLVEPGRSGWELIGGGAASGGFFPHFGGRVRSTPAAYGPQGAGYGEAEAED